VKRDQLREARTIETRFHGAGDGEDFAIPVVAFEMFIACSTSSAIGGLVHSLVEEVDVIFGAGSLNTIKLKIFSN
jgi:hypothetical protein